MSRTSREIYIYARSGKEPAFEVSFDRHDGAIEWVKYWDEISQDWALADSDHLLPGTREHIEAVIQDELNSTPNMEDIA